MWVSVASYKYRQFNECASEKELHLKLTKVMRSRWLSVTLPKLESDSGSGGNNLELVKNSLKSLELPKMEKEPFDGSPELFRRF